MMLLSYYAEMTHHSKKLSRGGILAGMGLAIFTVAGVYLLYPTELKIFWAGNIISIFVLIVTLDLSKQSERKMNSRIDTMIRSLNRIEEKLGITHTNEPTVDREK